MVARGRLLLGGLGSGRLDEWLKLEAAEALAAGGYRFVAYPPTGSTEVGGAPSLWVRVGIEMVRQPPQLVVVGAGHIALPLARMGKMLGFSVAVLDDRGSFANAERFPEADKVVARGFGEGLRALGIDGDSFVVLVTRGHQHDVECLRELIGIDAAYIGMIGSRRRVRAVFELLRQEGVPDNRLACVHAPIGIDIGAQTPAEIAVSIAAEIVKVRRGGQAVSLSERTVSEVGICLGGDPEGLG